MSTLRRFAAALAALTTVGVTSAVSLPAAEAASSCYSIGPGGSSPANRYVCPNWTGPIYANAGVTGSLSNPLRVTDNLRTTSSWFYCQTRFPGRNNPAYGVGKNDYWLLTVGDDYGRTGWFAANRIKIGDNWQPIPGVPACRF